jgi:hypothetical protein
MNLAYADPPYIGCAHLYKDHPDFAGEVDHAQLIERLEDEFDGWVLHASATLASEAILAPLVLKTGARKCAWVKGFAAFKKNVPVAYAWEPVYIKPARKPVVSKRQVNRDWIQCSITRAESRRRRRGAGHQPARRVRARPGQTAPLRVRPGRPLRSRRRREVQGIMPINRVRDRQGRPRLEFEFSRRIGGRRIRTRKLLPATWSRARADAFDRQECARLYAQASGIEARIWTIDDAVGRYLDDRAAELKTGAAIAAELAALVPLLAGPTAGRPARRVRRDFEGLPRPVAPATLMNKLRYLIAACRWGWKRGRMGPARSGRGHRHAGGEEQAKVYYDRPTMLRLARACQHRPTRARDPGRLLQRHAPAARSSAPRSSGRRLRPRGHEERRAARRADARPRSRCCATYEWPTKYVLTTGSRKARAAVGVARTCTSTTLRHSTASALLGEGVELRTVGLILGHKSTASTARYAHLALDKARAALAKIAPGQLLPHHPRRHRGPNRRFLLWRRGPESNRPTRICNRGSARSASHVYRASASRMARLSA